MFQPATSFFMECMPYTVLRFAQIGWQKKFPNIFPNWFFNVAKTNHQISKIAKSTAHAVGRVVGIVPLQTSKETRNLAESKRNQPLLVVSTHVEEY